MNLIARIDGNGTCFIGKHGEHSEWVKRKNVKPVTVVKNEKGNDIVMPEHIEIALSKHKYQGCAIHFFDEEVQQFYNNYFENQ